MPPITEIHLLPPQPRGLTCSWGSPGEHERGMLSSLIASLRIVSTLIWSQQLRAKSFNSVIQAGKLHLGDIRFVLVL